MVEETTNEHSINLENFQEGPEIKYTWKVIRNMYIFPRKNRHLEA